MARLGHIRAMARYPTGTHRNRNRTHRTLLQPLTHSHSHPHSQQLRARRHRSHRHRTPRIALQSSLLAQLATTPSHRSRQIALPRWTPQTPNPRPQQNWLPLRLPSRVPLTPPPRLSALPTRHHLHLAHPLLAFASAGSCSIARTLRRSRYWFRHRQRSHDLPRLRAACGARRRSRLGTLRRSRR